MSTFVWQLDSYLTHSDQKFGNLALVNLRDAYKRLSEMHSAFRFLFEGAPDYFGAVRLDTVEQDVHGKLVALVTALLADISIPTSSSVVGAVERWSRQQRRQAAQKLRAHVERGWVDRVHVPDECPTIDQLRYAAAVVEISGPRRIEDALALGTEIAGPLRDDFDFFCMLPAYRGKLVGERCYLFSADRAEELRRSSDTREHWETYFMAEIPREVRVLFPEYEVETPALLRLQSTVISAGFLVTLSKAAAKVRRLGEDADDGFARRAYDRQVEKLVGYAEDFRELVVTMSNQVAADFPSATRPRGVEQLLNILEISTKLLEEPIALRQEDWDEDRQSEVLNLVLAICDEVERSSEAV